MKHYDYVMREKEIEKLYYDENTSIDKIKKMYKLSDQSFNNIIKELRKIRRITKYDLKIISEHTLKESSQILNLPTRLITLICDFYDLEPKKKIKSKTAVKIIDELKKGNKEIEIAKKLNCSRQYVNQVKKIMVGNKYDI